MIFGKTSILFLNDKSQFQIQKCHDILRNHLYHLLLIQLQLKLTYCIEWDDSSLFY